MQTLLHIKVKLQWLSAILITIQGWVQVFLEGWEEEEMLSGALPTPWLQMSENLHSASQALGSLEEKRKDTRKVNWAVEEELPEVTQWVGIRTEWFSNYFPMNIPLRDGFANVSPQSALRCSPETVLKWQAQDHLFWADIPCLLSPSLFPLKRSMECYSRFLLVRYLLSRTVTEEFIFQEEFIKEEEILNWVAGGRKDLSKRKVFPLGGSKQIQMRGYNRRITFIYLEKVCFVKVTVVMTLCSLAVTHKIRE